MDDMQARFRELQERMRDMWPMITLRSIGEHERTIVVIHSVSMDVPAQLAPVFGAYEERFLCLLLTLLRGPRSRVVYVTSQPILPRLIEYWFELVPELNTAQARRRLSLVSLSDGSPAPLAQKLLRHPRVLERIRLLVPDPNLALIVPFTTTQWEVELGVRLGLPVYGTDPALYHLGSKSGSRRLFREEGVPLPFGVEGVQSLADVVEAIRAIRAERPGVRDCVVKLDYGVSGLGNGLVHVEGAESRRDIEVRALDARLEDEAAGIEQFYAQLEAEGGIVEERIVAAEVRSPSVQLRASPMRDVEVLSTHDQLLGGTHGLSFLGARFPADLEYGPAIAREAVKVGRRLARDGAIGRFALDFVVAREPGGEWQPYAIEINLRAGGTTHPFMALQSLTDGVYDAEAGVFHAADGSPKYYVASDHLESPTYAALTPEDLLDVIAARQLGWDHVHNVGLAFHLVSALAVAGRIGVTAIGDSHGEASSIYRLVERTLEEEVAALSR